jgi:hypothetical protein
MQRRHLTLALVTALVLAGCAKKTTRHQWLGIEIEIPKETSISNSGTSTPSQGTFDPDSIRPGIVLMRPNTHDYFVEVVKLPRPLSSAGLRYALQAQPSFVSAVRETGTSNAWQLDYRWKNPDSTTVTVFHRYVAFGSAYYECTYSDGNTKDLPTAASICASIRPVP